MPATPAGNYHDLDAYKKADDDTRRQLERWKAAEKIGDDHMYLLLSQKTLRDLPPEKKKEGNRTAEMMVVFAILFFVVIIQTKQRVPMLIASVLVITSTLFYLSGVLNPISSQLKRLRRMLKKYPTIQPFDEWSAANPAPPQKGKGKKQA